MKENSTAVSIGESPQGDGSEHDTAPLSASQAEIAALLWHAGIVRAVFRSLRLSLSQHDELIGELGLWLCLFCRDHAHGAKDIRALAFVSLRNKALSYLKRNGRRKALLGKRVDESTIPQSRYCPDTSLFMDDPEAVRIILSARISKPTNFTRKQFEIRTERLRRLKQQHGR